MNILIAGDGEVGAYLAKMLTGKKHNITFISPQKTLLDSLESHSDLLTILGDSTSMKVLNEASVNEADLLMSILHDEQVNILTCILAKKLGAKKVIARISSLEYLDEDNKAIFHDMGVDEIVCPERIAADECIDLISQAGVTEVYDFAGGMLSLQLFHLTEQAKIIGASTKELNHATSMKEDVKVLAVSRNNYVFVPNDNDVFQVDDLVYTINKPRGKSHLLNLTGNAGKTIKNVMIVGGGRIAQMMAKELGGKINLKVIEIDSVRCENLAGQFNAGVLVVNGDARDVEVLEDEDISNMDAFVAVTDNSETNIMTCLLAKRYGVNKVIALMDNVEYIDLVQRFGIDGIINKKLITASYMTRFTLGADVSNIKFLSAIDGEVVEIRAKRDSKVTKKPIGSLTIPEGAVFGGIVRGYESHIATDDFQIQEDDRVVMFCLSGTVENVITMFNKKKFLEI